MAKRRSERNCMSQVIGYQSVPLIKMIISPNWEIILYSFYIGISLETQKKTHKKRFGRQSDGNWRLLSMSVWDLGHSSMPPVCPLFRSFVHFLVKKRFDAREIIQSPKKRWKGKYWDLSLWQVNSSFYTRGMDNMYTFPAITWKSDGDDGGGGQWWIWENFALNSNWFDSPLPPPLLPFSRQSPSLSSFLPFLPFPSSSTTKIYFGFPFLSRRGIVCSTPSSPCWQCCIRC